MTFSSAVQAKGQVTIPHQARAELGIEPGDQIQWIRNENGRWEIWTFDALLDHLEPSLAQLPAWLAKTKPGFNPKP